MSPLHSIELCLKRAARRRRWMHVWRGLWWGTLAGALVWVLALTVYKLLPVPAQVVPWSAAAAGLLVLAGASAGAFRRVSLQETARWLDDRKHFEERLSTAWELGQSPREGEWKELLLVDAAKHVSEINPRQLLPVTLPRAGRWALIALVVGAGLGFIPEYRTKAYQQKKAEAANIHETGRQLAELTRRELKERPPLLEPTEKAMESTAELGEMLGKANLTRSEALKDLASMTDKVDKEAERMLENPVLKRMEEAARQTSGGAPAPGDMQKQMDQMKDQLGKAGDEPDALQKLKNDLQKAQEAAAGMADKNSAASEDAKAQLAQTLSQLSKQAADLGVSAPNLEKAIAALQSGQAGMFLKDLEAAVQDLEKMQAMAQSMQQLQQQMARMGKDLAEQLQNGQAKMAQSTLHKMINELKNANLSPQQMSRMMEEVSKAIDPGNKYGQVGKFLKDAAQQMQEGQKPQAAESLAKASQELDKLLQQMADAQSLARTLDSLQRAQQAIALGKTWSQVAQGECPYCHGAGCSQCLSKLLRWGRGGRPGKGVGTWADENSGWSAIPQSTEPFDPSDVKRPDMASRGQTDRGEGDPRNDLLPDQVRGQFSPGGSMPSITLKGVSIKGSSSVQYQQAVQAAQSEAQSALNQDEVPRAYQGAVRNYFDELDH